MSTKERYEFIDVAKGIGIILVILGHLLTSGSPGSSIIYSFHMPLFFLISGIFANPDKTKFLPYLGKNIKRLILPYICVFIIGTLVSFIIPAWRDGLTVQSLISQFIYAGPEAIHVGQIWFLACLFNVVIIFYPFYKLILKRNNIALNILCVVALPIIYGFIPFLPFKLAISVMALFFYSVGYVAKKVILSKSPVGVVILLFIFSLISTILEFRINGYTNLGAAIFNDLYYYIFFALCGIATVIALSKFISKVKLLQFLGKNSLFIFSLHSFLIYLYEYILSLLHNTEIVHCVNMSLIESIIGCVIITGIMMIFAYLFNKSKIFLSGSFLKLTGKYQKTVEE